MRMTSLPKQSGYSALFSTVQCWLDPVVLSYFLDIIFNLKPVWGPVDGAPSTLASGTVMWLGMGLALKVKVESIGISTISFSV